MVSDLHRNSSAADKGDTDGHRPSVSTTLPVNSRILTISQTRARSAISNTMGSTVLLLYSVPSGELPPQPPRACFGRDELIEETISLAENLTPIALIGPGGIGKTSIALTVLHHDRIKERFGDNRRFIRCDQFPASRTHFLSRLSKVIGAGVENPEDLTPLRRFLSSREMILFLDNAESILDSHGVNAQEIYATVEELSRFDNICLCITSRISTIPPDCKRLDIPTLSMDAACHTFYRIYDGGEPSNLVSDILEQLDFHPLSITLLATVAYHNKWGTNRLTREWDRRRTGVLHAQHNKSLAATIELSLASPMFQELGPDARDLLGVVAFFPQGVDEDSLEWLFPDISDGIHIFDKFCILSLTYRSNGFIRMLAPLRDHLSPKDPASSPLLCVVKDCYFRRLSVDIYPDKPGYKEARWIISEDLNVEHLLDVFTSLDANSVGVWAACCNFMEHLFRHKPRLVVLGPKIEALPDDHPSKPQCLLAFSRLPYSAGNYMEYKRLLTHALKLWREQGDDRQVAQTLKLLSESNGELELHKEGIPQAREASEIYEQLNDISGRADALQYLAWLLDGDKQLDAAEEAGSLAIDLLPDQGEEFLVCQCRRILGNICHSKGKAEDAINHFETALRIASSFDWDDEQFWNHHSLAVLLSTQGRFDDAHAHVERAKSHAVNTPFYLGCAMELQARFWYEQRRFKEAESEALRAADVYEKVGTANGVENCRAILHDIEREMKNSVTSDESDSDGEPLETVLLLTLTNSRLPARGTRQHPASVVGHTLPRTTDPTSG